jgi:hypothetical protein
MGSPLEKLALGLFLCNQHAGIVGTTKLRQSGARRANALRHRLISVEPHFLSVFPGENTEIQPYISRKPSGSPLFARLH